MRQPTRVSKKLEREYADVRAAAEAAERRGDEPEAKRLAREYQRLTIQISDICRRANARAQGA